MNYSSGDEALIWALQCWSEYVDLLNEEDLDRCDVEGVTGAINEISAVSMICGLTPKEVACLMLEITRERNDKQ